MGRRRLVEPGESLEERFGSIAGSTPGVGQCNIPPDSLVAAVLKGERHRLVELFNVAQIGAAEPVRLDSVVPVSGCRSRELAARLLGGQGAKVQVMVAVNRQFRAASLQ